MVLHKESATISTQDSSGEASRSAWESLSGTVKEKPRFDTGQKEENPPEDQDELASYPAEKNKRALLREKLREVRQELGIETPHTEKFADEALDQRVEDIAVQRIGQRFKAIGENLKDLREALRESHLQERSFDEGNFASLVEDGMIKWDRVSQVLTHVATAFRESFFSGDPHEMQTLPSLKKDELKTVLERLGSLGEKLFALKDTVSAVPRATERETYRELSEMLVRLAQSVVEKKALFASIQNSSQNDERAEQRRKEREYRENPAHT